MMRQTRDAHTHNGQDMTKAAPAKTEGQPRRSGRTAVRLTDRKVSPSTSEAEGGKRRRRGDEVRSRILAAALDCFGAFGFDGTSTRAVAERADVTHTLVLYHFQSKDKLWTATIEAALEEYGAQIRADLEAATSESAKVALARFVEQFVRMSAEKPQIHRILTAEGNQGTDRLDWVIENFLQWHYSAICELVRRGQSEGTVRQCDPARLYYLIIGTGGTPFTLAVEYERLTGRDVFSEAEILRNIAFIFEILFV
ncbi:TetR family transcriptional regulator [Novosphingobium sp. 9U]|nr:TetR family transcriptional regulator [Novosphingobium sp. 9U]